MKNRRAILYLALALALTLGAHLLLSYKHGIGAPLIQRTTLVDASLASKPVRIAVERPGSTATVLALMNSWRLVEPYSAAADERAVLKLLDLFATSEIEDAKSDQYLSSLGRTRSDYGLDEPSALRVTISAADSSAATILLGSKTPDGSGVYASVDGEDAVLVVPAAVKTAADLDASGFRRKTLLPENAGSVNSFDLKRGTASFMRFVRDGENWTMTEPRKTAAAAAKIKNMLSLVASAEADDFVWPIGAKGESETATVSLLAGYGLDPESAVTLTMRCADGSEQQISFGKAAKDGLVYALIQNAGAIAVVPGDLKDLTFAGVAEFTDSRLFPFDPASAARISISSGETTYLLAKSEDGLWRLDSPVAAPTDPATLSSLLERLFALTSVDVAPGGSSPSERVGISISQASSAQSQQQETPETLQVLKSAVLGSLRLEDLRSREILKVDPADVKRLVVTGFRSSTPTSVVYDKDRRAWNVEKSPLDGSVNTPAVEAAIEELSPLVADAIVKLKVAPADLRRWGLETPRGTIAVDQDRASSLRRNILIGDSLESGGVYATLGATEAVFILPEKTVRRLQAPLVNPR